MNDIPLVIRIALGLVFVVAAAAKLRDPAAFVDGVRQYRLMPTAAWIVAPTVIALEAALGVAHFANWNLDRVALAGVATLAAFATASSIALARHDPIPCMCFGGGNEEVSLKSLLRLALLIAGEAIIAVNGRSAAAAAPVAADRIAYAALSAVGLIVVAAWSIDMADFLELWRGCSVCKRAA